MREFLQHWGLNETLAKLDVEAPRTKTSICNRSQLAQSLHVAPLIRRNSNLLRPFRSVVEMIVWDVLQSPRFNQAANSRPVSANPRGNGLPLVCELPLLFLPCSQAFDKRKKSEFSTREKRELQRCPAWRDDSRHKDSRSFRKRWQVRCHA